MTLICSLGMLMVPTCPDSPCSSVGAPSVGAASSATAVRPSIASKNPLIKSNASSLDLIAVSSILSPSTSLSILTTAFLIRSIVDRDIFCTSMPSLTSATNSAKNSSAITASSRVRPLPYTSLLRYSFWKAVSLLANAFSTLVPLLNCDLTSLVNRTICFEFRSTALT